MRFVATKTLRFFRTNHLARGELHPPLDPPVALWNMARPLKPDDVRRTHTIRVRVNDGEKSSIEQNAKFAGRTPSDFLRGLGTDHIAKPERIVPTPDREILHRLLAEINKIGSNLNQIARQLNRKQDSPELQGFDPSMLEITKHSIDTLTKHLIDTLTK